jgi:histone H2A
LRSSAASLLAACYSLSKLLGTVTIASGGVLPNIHTMLLPKKGKKGEAAAE